MNIQQNTAMNIQQNTLTNMNIQQLEAVLFGQDAVEQRGLAGPEGAEKNRSSNERTDRTRP